MQLFKRQDMCHLFTSSFPLPEGWNADVMTETGVAFLHNGIETILLNIDKQTRRLGPWKWSHCMSPRLLTIVLLKEINFYFKNQLCWLLLQQWTYILINSVTNKLQSILVICGSFILKSYHKHWIRESWTIASRGNTGLASCKSLDSTFSLRIDIKSCFMCISV